ncbi:GNAT family N-acetyltransferase [Saccharibacillus sp. CPCC 101409]|uniref:GNAT family N-acetyltransferase n=1 Tax=Saccharibacillus sp. CPCC 101409 TaxID=3058041 RepID=UPI002673611A|nr:GNAT family N-acetyltransferase [Saccharibacillus sp. CPCC 101409]MDO3410540.1 GNAT family N-acetyltransferase [Saccharibacillus sp. CPCC 101409]
MNDSITIRRLSCPKDAELLDRTFADIYPWHTPGDYYERCLEENRQGSRITLIASYDGVLAGGGHLLLRSEYPHFREAGIPEINDLNVFPKFRQKGIAARLLDELERSAAGHSSIVGLGVGLYADYGSAQRIYTGRGYVLDGRGLQYRNQPVPSGQTVTVDDDLLLYLVKKLDNGGL